MLIAFEGPDNVGKSTSATTLSAMPPIYNATKENHAAAQLLVGAEKGTIECFDRIDWLTHMVYRLALPDHEWNDARVRTVFAMPDTHLVIKVHHESTVPQDDTEEGYAAGKPHRVNSMYRHYAHFLMSANELMDFALFKTISLVKVYNNLGTGEYMQRLMEFSSPVTLSTVASRLVYNDETLVRLLEYEDQHAA